MNANTEDKSSHKAGMLLLLHIQTHGELEMN